MKLDWMASSVQRRVLFVILVLLSAFAGAMGIAVGEDVSAQNCLVVLGAPGEAEYGVAFRTWGERWRSAMGAEHVAYIDGTQISNEAHSTENEESNRSSDSTSIHSSESSDKEKILEWLDALPAVTPESPSAPVWIVLIGHGTSDTSGSKFNLRGPDLAADELHRAVSAHASRRFVLIHCFSSSGPFLSALSGPNRVVITSTKSGSEWNYSRFGDFLSKAITDPTCDLDHDDNLSILEAYLAASKGVARYYLEEGRLASEQALLDDNGDRKGTPASFYQGLRPVKAPAQGLALDGDLAKRLFVHRIGPLRTMDAEKEKAASEIEERIAALRRSKKELSEKDYLEQLEKLLLELSKQIIAPE